MRSRSSRNTSSPRARPLVDAIAVSPNTERARSLILYAIWMTVLTGILLWSAYLVREVLLLLYISALLAIGFSPIVRLIERQSVLPIGTRLISSTPQPTASRMACG